MMFQTCAVRHMTDFYKTWYSYVAPTVRQCRVHPQTADRSHHTNIKLRCWRNQKTGLFGWTDRRNTYLLTPWSRVLLEKLAGLQLVKKFPAFYGTRRFITAFESARHLSLSWASSIQSIPPHLTSWKSVLILSSHLRLGLPSGIFPSGFPTKTL
jgi:hypothetical protein